MLNLCGEKYRLISILITKFFIQSKFRHLQFSVNQVKKAKNPTTIHFEVFDEI